MTEQELRDFIDREINRQRKSVSGTRSLNLSVFWWFQWLAFLATLAAAILAAAISEKYFATWGKLLLVALPAISLGLQSGTTQLRFVEMIDSMAVFADKYADLHDFAIGNLTKCSDDDARSALHAEISQKLSDIRTEYRIEFRRVLLSVGPRTTT